MSYSSKLKYELAKLYPSSRHCRLAEIFALISLLGKIKISEDDGLKLIIASEYPYIARKCFTLLKKTFNISSDVAIGKTSLLKRKHRYILTIQDDSDVRYILTATKLMDADGSIRESEYFKDNLLLQNNCCKRAYLRGVFLATGSVSNPDKAYHFEMVIGCKTVAEHIKQVLYSLGIDAKIILRKQLHIVYVKESDRIAGLFGLMGASNSLMEFENIRILKEMRNNVNRKVNCETANINKTVSAAFKQIQDIEYIRDSIGLNKLSEPLRRVAEMRLEHPSASLQELSDYMDGKIGKSGINHRLRKISNFAQNLLVQKNNIMNS